MKKTMMRNSILFYSLVAISFSSLADTLKSQEFEAYIQTQDVKLSGGQVIVSCRAYRPLAKKMVDYKATGPITVAPATGNYYKLHFGKVEALKYKGFANTCTMGIELHGVDTKGEHISGSYSLDGFEVLMELQKKISEEHSKLKADYAKYSDKWTRAEMDKYDKKRIEIETAGWTVSSYLDCPLNRLTTGSGVTECKLKTPDGENYREKFYSIIQKNLASLVLKKFDGKIFFGATSSYSKGIIKTMETLDKDFEKYWRKRRVGVDTEEIISVEKPSSSGSLVGMIMGTVITGSLGGFAAGGVLGNALDNHTLGISTTSIPLPVPYVDINKMLIDNTLGFAPSNDMIISLSLLDLYQNFLYQKRNLTKTEIQDLKTLKELWSPKLDSILTKIIEKDYENQGICVRYGDCHLKK